MCHSQASEATANLDETICSYTQGGYNEVAIMNRLKSKERSEKKSLSCVAVRNPKFLKVKRRVG
jgi:hypothetical protein